MSAVGRPAGRTRPPFPRPACSARIHGAPGQRATAQAITSALLAPFFTRRPATAALTSMGLTSMMGTGHDASTPTAMPSPKAEDAACVPPVGTSTKAKAAPSQALMSAARSSCPRRSLSLLRLTTFLSSPSVLTRARPSQAIVTPPGPTSTTTRAKPMLAKAASTPTARILITASATTCRRRGAAARAAGAAPACPPP